MNCPSMNGARLAARVTGAILALGLGVAAACHSDGSTAPTSTVPANLASCGSGTALFTVFPVPTEAISGWVPLGAMNPPAHTFPTDHQYIYLKSGTGPVALSAPGRITITRARATTYTTGAGNTDYALTFMPCAEVMGDFGHVSALSPALLQQIGAFDQQCSSYSPSPGVTVRSCYSRTANIVVEAGTVIGQTQGLDLSLFDTRITPLAFANDARWTRNSNGFDHFHVVPFSDYFADPTRSTVRDMLGSFDGRIRRTTEPRGGTIASDLPGTAQGAWLATGQPTYPEVPHVAFAPDHVDPSRITVSIGSPLNGLASGGYYMTPSSSGLANRAPAAITPGATVHCWEIGYAATDRRGAVLVQLVDANTIKVEGKPGASTTCDTLVPFTLSAFAVTFVR